MITKTNAVQTAFLIVSLALLLTACQTPAAVTTPEPTTTQTAPAEPTTIPATAVTTQGTPSVTINIDGVAQDVDSLLVAAVPPSTERPWWEPMPEHTLLTLQGYPVLKHKIQPQIFVYPLKDLSMNEAAAKAAESLQTLLQSQQPGESMPYLPLSNEVQMMYAQVKFLDFKNGSGVRYLTEYSQGIVPVNNRELIYTYQGLTTDGSYYVAVVLPVNLPGLPADESSTTSLPADFTDNYIQYMADTVENLNQQSASAYTPDLGKLDAMMQSIEVK